MKIQISPYSSLIMNSDLPDYVRQEEYIHKLLLGDPIRMQIGIDDTLIKRVDPLFIINRSGYYTVTVNGVFYFQSDSNHREYVYQFINTAETDFGSNPVFTWQAEYSPSADVYIAAFDKNNNVLSYARLVGGIAFPVPADASYLSFSVPTSIALPWSGYLTYNTVEIKVRNLSTGQTEKLTTVEAGTSDDMTYLETYQIVTDLGCYSYEIYANEALKVRMFYKVVDSIDNSVMFRFRDHYDRNDALLDDYFYFRCEGTVPPKNFTPNAEHNNFRDQYSSLHALSGFTFNIYKFVIGSPKGVPVQVIDKVNRILTCTEVYMNGREVTRSENSAPELTIQDVSCPLFLATVDFEYVDSDRIIIEDETYEVVAIKDHAIYNVVDSLSNNVII